MINDPMIMAPPFLSSSASRGPDAAAADTGAGRGQSSPLLRHLDHDDHHLPPSTPGAYPPSPPAHAAKLTTLVSEDISDDFSTSIVLPDSSPDARSHRPAAGPQQQVPEVDQLDNRIHDEFAVTESALSSSSSPKSTSDTAPAKSPLPAEAPHTAFDRATKTKPTGESNDVTNSTQARPANPRSHSVPPPRAARRKSLPASSTLLRRHALEKSADELQQAFKTLPISAMRRAGKPANDDLFLELANDEAEAVEQPSSAARRHERAASRASLVAKHRSLPPPAASDSSYEDSRPLTSGNTSARRAVSRFNQPSSDALYSTGSLRDALGPRESFAQDEIASSRFSSASRVQQYTDMQDRASGAQSRLVQRLRSPERSQLTQRRLSMASSSPEAHRTHGRLASSRLHDLPVMPPPHDSERKPSLPDSASVESDAAESAVWDEIDDLKSRIKKIELTGKMPTTSSATVSAEQSERPRTATTAPTTIGSSPKHEKPSENTSWTGGIVSDSTSTLVAVPNVTKIHPMLHEALARAKKLLKPALFRQLDETASDALQLAAMTGSSGSQGAAAFNATSPIRNTAISDRQMRRKADNMCRNLTDVIVSLCEGKHETPPSTMMSSPAADMQTPTGASPSLRFPRSVSRQNSVSRPMSRLEARRSSILGPSSRSHALENAEERSGSEEEETTPSHHNSHDLRTDSRRLSYHSAISANPSSTNSRLHQAAHMPRYDTYEPASDDDDYDQDANRNNNINNIREDLTIRPLSRARTEVGSSFSSRLNPGYQHAAHHHHHQHSQQVAHRSPSLRESLAARRAVAAADANYHVPSESHHRLSRVASLSSNSRIGLSRASIAEEAAAGDEQIGRRRQQQQQYEDYDDDNADSTARAEDLARKLPAFRPHQRRTLSVRGSSGTASAFGMRNAGVGDDNDSVGGASLLGRTGSVSSRRKRAAS